MLLLSVIIELFRKTKPPRLTEINFVCVTIVEVGALIALIRVDQ